MNTYSNIDNTHSNIYRRLDASKPAITISHYRKSMIIHPTQDRGISFREASRLQSFPDWFRFAGPVDERQQQLANAVPPLLASSIAYAIAQCWMELNPTKLRVRAIYNFARGS
jgi:DNA (cytosine-5)-methyltransferase 1